VLKRLPFGPLEPDKPISLSRAYNAFPAAEGYRPVKSPVTFAASLPGIINGASYVSSDGVASMIAGTATNLYRYDGTNWNSVLGSLAVPIWRFAQFGDLSVAVNGGAPVKYDLTGGTAAALGGAPPVSDLVATVRDQVFLAGDPTARNTLAISGYNDAEGWTAGTNQCLYVPFPNGGDIMGLAGGETAIILQRNSVRRATYLGDPTVVWSFDEIASDIGCMAKGSVAREGNLVFFLSEEGFKVTDRNEVRPIGQEKIDREFFSLYSRDDIKSMTSAVDPRTTTVMWAIPGTPGRIWCYDWTLGAWSTIDLSLRAIFSGFTTSTSLEAIDALYPGGVDTVPISLDSDVFAGGNPLLVVAGYNGSVYTLSGPNMAATFAFKPTEIGDGQRARIRGARVVSDAVQGTVTVDVRARAGDAASTRTSGGIRDNGRVPLRANGRHVGVQVDIPAGADWNYAIGVDLEFEQAGGR
jgi:hypothetical protein